MSGERDYETEAKAMGWQSSDEFKGDQATFVSAEDFVKRGETLMPILKANNRKLLSEVGAVTAKVTKLESLLAQSNEQIAALLEINTAAKQKEAKETKRELVSAIEEARKEGNTEQVVALTEQLDEHAEALKTATAKPVVKQPAAAGPSAEEKDIWDKWVSDTPWWDKDEDRTALGVAMATKLRNKGSALKGRAFFDAVAAEVERLMPFPSARNGAGKVEGARPSGGGGSGGGEAARDYAALPSEAREACDRMMGRLKTQPGQPGSIFKDAKAYRAHFAAKYFEESAA